MGSGGDVRTLLRQHDFRRFIVALGASELGSRMAIVALAFAALDVRHTASAVGIVLGVGSIAFLIGLAAGGVLGDRFHRRRIMMACDLGRLLSQGLSAALVFSGHAELWSLAVLRGATEFGTGVFNPVSQGLMQTVVAERSYRAAAGVRATAVSLGEAVGPVLGGVIVAAAGPAWGLAADAATFAVSAAALAGIRAMEVPAAATDEDVSTFRQLAQGWTAFRTRRWLWSVITAAAITQFAWGAWAVLGPVVASRSLGGAAPWGAILAAMGVGAVVGATVATRVTAREPLKVFLAGYLTFAIPLAALAAGASTAVVAAAAVLAGIGILVGESVWEATLLASIPDDLISRMSAYDWFGSTALVPIGLALWGPIASVAGTSAALWLAAALTVLPLLALLLVPEVRHFDEAPAAGRPEPAHPG